MPLNSMTGFARADGARGPASWHWELRSVNGKGLDVRLRLPPGLEGLEPKAREAAVRKLQRGNVTASLTLARVAGEAAIRLNEAAVRQVAAAAEQARRILPLGELTLDGLLAIRGVLEVGEAVESEAEAALRESAILATFETALVRLGEARRSEGARLEDILAAALSEVEQLTEAAARLPQRSPERIEARLREQIERLFAAGPQLEPVRLHQEAMLLAARADVEEELQRLRSHVTAGRELLASGEPAGRKLDFLTQELNREANTLCSKSSDTELTRLGLRLKATIDQLREQVQNVE